MFYLLQSIWMFATAGVAIPVIIHFWNRKQGKTLKVGSISLLTQSYKQQAKSLQLQERLLLLLRCLLILIIALLLSHPVWKEEVDASKQQGWILMEKQGLQQTYTRFKPFIDSLMKQHYEFHYFDAGFEKENFESVLKNKDAVIQSNVSYWSLLSSLDQQVPATLPVYLFTDNSLQRFTGNRPQVSMRLQWHTYTAKDSVSEWLSKAYLTTADSIRLVAATSKPSGTSYLYKNAAIAAQKQDGYTVHTSNNISVSYQNKQPVEVDTATIKITLFTDNYGKDATYIKAAFEAIQQYSKRKIKLSLVHHSADIPHQQDWIFWLADQPVSIVDGKNIFVYEKGKAEVVTSFIQTENNGSGDEYVALHKRIPFQSSGLVKAIWQDGFGNPLLELENGKVPVYHFFSRFNPSWNDLPWSNAFPRMIFNMIWNQQYNTSIFDNRIMDEQQLQPIFATSGNTQAKHKFLTTHDLTKVFWLAAFVVFFIERYLSFETKTEKINA